MIISNEILNELGLLRLQGQKSNSNLIKQKEATLFYLTGKSVCGPQAQLDAVVPRMSSACPARLSSQTESLDIELCAYL